MQKRGLRFIIPNDYGSFLSEILEPTQCCKYNWSIDNDEIHLIIDGVLTDNWLFKETVVRGSEFSKYIGDNTYYVVFAELKAFPTESPVTSISSYNEFLTSKCEIMILIYDCIYVDIYCKDQVLLERLFNNAINKGYGDVRYIDEDDVRTKMSVF